jgi:ferric-dicitrate binding protein FerR (iron transport regulator)
MSHTLTPEQRQALKMAAQWFALLCDENVTEHQRQQWQAWHQQNEDHRWAWQRVEALQSQLQGVPGKFSYRTLDQAGRQSTLDRRTLLKSLLLLLGVGGSWLGFQSPLGRELRADYRTATGEIKPIVLSDGSQLVLNTASAVDVRYSAEKRLILLHSGEISLITGRDDRPFWVESRQGAMRALGTHFLVRENDDKTQLTVLEHAVEAQLAQFPQEKTTGQRRGTNQLQRCGIRPTTGCRQRRQLDPRRAECQSMAAGSGACRTGALPSRPFGLRSCHCRPTRERQFPPEGARSRTPAAQPNAADPAAKLYPLLVKRGPRLIYLNENDKKSHS